MFTSRTCISVLYQTLVSTSDEFQSSGNFDSLEWYINVKVKNWFHNKMYATYRRRCWIIENAFESSKVAFVEDDGVHQRTTPS